MPSRAARISLAYLAIAGLWIVGSDALVERLVDSPALLAGVQTWKGLGFVLATALCLYVLLRAAPPPAASAAPEPNERLRGVLLGLTFLLLAALIVGFGSLVYEREKAAFRERQYAQQAAILKLKAGQVERWVVWQRKVAEALRHDRELVAAVAAATRQASAAAQGRMMSHLAGFLSGGLWQDAALHAADGSLLLRAGSAAAPEPACCTPSARRRGAARSCSTTCTPPATPRPATASISSCRWPAPCSCSASIRPKACFPWSPAGRCRARHRRPSSCAGKATRWCS